MATYFHGGNTEMQGNGDALQTLILMNPAAYVNYSDNQHHLPPPPSSSNFIFLNSSNASHLTGIPLQAAAAASSPQHQDARFHYYNLYSNGGGAAREVTRAKQGLSLSLSPQHPVAPPPGSPEKAALSCKYLKAAQELLDEVVNIGKEGKNRESDNGEPKKNAEPAAGDGRAKRGAELTTAEKQEIQMKRAKLADMLDEVEQRYKQYHEQMQMVIRWLEEAAGVGSAKTYTALALQAISKQFRCLKDAIRAATADLGEERGKMEAPPRLHFQINNAWRPQRGLPERSVSVLRAWLFQHFLHPYPKDSDKVMLAKQAGLTRSQVSNWFINARVRLWKPMVEEMYAQEMTTRSEGDQVSTSPTANNIGSSEMDSTLTRPKKPRNADVSPSPSLMSMSDVDNQHIMKFDYDSVSERQSRQGFTITGAPASFFGPYDPIVGIERPYSTNGVSLTLGLQHCEGLSDHSFVPSRSVEAAARGDDFGGLSAVTHASGVYGDMDVVHGGRRFTPAQLLPDFVTQPTERGRVGGDRY